MRFFSAFSQYKRENEQIGDKHACLILFFVIRLTKSLTSLTFNVDSGEKLFTVLDKTHTLA